MKTAAHTTFAERSGRTVGRMWKGAARLDRKARGLLVASGLSGGVSAMLMWAVKLAALGVLLYFAFWLALLLLIVVVASWTAQHGAAYQEEEDDLLGRQAEERDHREGLFYHPASYNDDPDPRFEDD